MKKMNLKKLQVLAPLTLLVLAACQGSSDPVASTPAPTSPSAINAQGAALVGEFVNYSIDATRQTYSYEIIDSQFGLAGRKNVGTLMANPDGTYTPSSDANARVVIGDGFVLGHIKESFNGGQSVPVLGVANPVLSFAQAASIYNFVQASCTATNTDCVSTYGTFEVSPSGAWRSCVQGDLVADSSCTGKPMLSGTLNNLGNGRFQVMDANGGVDVGTALSYVASNGQKVLVLDLKDNRSVAAGSLGRGVLVGAEQRSVFDGSGTYIASSLNGTSKVSVLGALFSNAPVSGTNTQGSLEYNQPFAGITTVKDANNATLGFALLGGSGLYGYVDKNSGVAGVQNSQIGVRLK